MRLRRNRRGFKLGGKHIYPHLMIPERVMKLLQAYVDVCPVEINGFGLIRQLSAGVFRLDEVYILDQQVSYVHAVTDTDALSQNDSELAERGEYELRRFQWHSHVDFEAYFSNVDVRNIMRREESWLISMVLNKFGHFEARLDLNIGGVRRQRPLTVTIVLEPDMGSLIKATDDIERHVRVVNTPQSIGYRVLRTITRGATPHDES